MVKNNSNKALSLGYRNMSLFYVVTFLLSQVVLLGVMSVVIPSLLCFKIGCLLVSALMIIDILSVNKNSLKRIWYIAHHLFSFIWPLLVLYHAEYFFSLNAGFLGYMLLGAFFRRLRAWGKLYKHKKIERTSYWFMIFFDFCDILVIIFCWQWLLNLSLVHQVFYYTIVLTRVMINGKAYPKEKRLMKKWFIRKLSTAR